MHTVLELLNHTLPIVIMVFILVAFLLIRHWHHIFHHVDLVAKAGDEEGEIEMAKHLAHKAGGPRIHVGPTWESFRPAARELHQFHVDKKQNLTSES